MTKDAHPFMEPTAGRRGLWQALVEADAARSSAVVDEPVETCSDVVIDLAGHAQAHLGYLERVAASPGQTSVVIDVPMDAISARADVVVDLAEHRSRRSLIA